MIQIRKNVFETNSSSTHSIAIPNHKLADYPRVVHFGIGEFGWSFEEVNPADYLYTAILAYYCDPKEREEKLSYLKDVLDRHNILYTMQEPKFETWPEQFPGKEWLDLDCGYIDHTGELSEFLEAVFKDEDTLLNFIFNGLVFTGNDNSYDDERPFVNRTSPTYECYEYDSKTKKETTEEKKNPYYKESYVTDYDWYYKGN
jgi:hypothetical protein